MSFDRYRQSCWLAMVAAMHFILSGCVHAPTPPGGAIFDVTFRPVRAGGAEIAAIEVRAELKGNAPTVQNAEPFSIAAPITYASVTGIADRIEQLKVSDRTGPLVLTVKDDAANPGGFPFYRHWIADRPVVYPVVITYRSLPQSTPPVPGPQFSFRAHDGGLSSAGSGFLALPENTPVAVTRVHWDLSELAAGSLAASSFGEGDIELQGAPDQLIQGYFMVGPIGRYAPAEASGEFVAYWLGTPMFDPRKEMAWSFEVYRFQRKFFRDKSQRTYRMFVRAIPGSTRGGGGTALENSFMLAVQPGNGDASVTSPRGTIAHEMSHMFVGGVEGEGGGPWFEEGLNEYYTHRVLLRSGLETVDAFGHQANEAAEAYYSNPYRNESAAALDKLGFSAGVGSGSAQNVPYNRGLLYFATVDAKIRAASRGKRNLDDVILPLFVQRQHGQPFHVPALVAAFEKEYGSDARSDFEAIIVRGETVVPPPEAFGPCFERRAKTYTVQGKSVEGYEWLRVRSVSDERCREW